MAYRDAPVDPRVVELEALIAAEPGLRSKIAPLRLAHDELQNQLDVLGPQLSEAEATLAKRREGGVLATLGGWLGKSIEEHQAEMEKHAAAHARLTAEVTALAAEERELWAKIAQAVDAKAELARMRELAIDAMRTAEGPVGEEVRALDADDARDRAQVAAIVRMLDLVDLARTAVWQIQTVAADLTKLTGLGSTVTAILERFDSPLSESQTSVDRESTRERLGEAIAYAAIHLRALIAQYDDAGCEWFARMPRPRVLELAAGRRRIANVEESPCVRQAEPLIECMFELAGGLGDKRDRLLRDLAGRAARRDELAVRGWS
jgi:hypothetical protein